MNQNGSGGGVGGGGSVYGRMGGPYDRWVEPTDRSPLGRVQQQYWTTKQTLMRKLGKKEDEHVVASDSELDAKLEMYSSIDETCLDLDRLLGFYQDQLCVLSQEENSLGRFLKEQGKEDKTRAGKMMVAVGKTMSYTAQQRLALRSPLLRLHQEVETFHNRAVKDTAQTVRTMEKVRTEYRGTLLWMKDISQELDPDTYKQLEKFRKVQMQVKKNKQRFDKLKVDCLQKIDLLAASRCNMFSHALVLYQDALLQFWEKTARTMNHVAESFKGYQYYEFSVIKELCEPSRQLADRTSSSRPAPAQPAVGAAAAAPAEQDGDKLISLDLDQPDDDAETDASSAAAAAAADDDMLLDLGGEETGRGSEESGGQRQSHRPLRHAGGGGAADLLTHHPEIPDLEKEDQELLEEILAAPSAAAAAAQPGLWHTEGAQEPAQSGGHELQDVFGGLSLGGGAQYQSSAFMPSQLFGSGGRSAAGVAQMAAPAGAAAAAPVASQGPVPQPKSAADKQKDMSAWYSLFADLDPLANPDAVGKKKGEEDRNC
ncbi:Islet cell autoantigen 1 [Amphibalanus amphitrite]|uniref:Islet cell autoantigen 1 n=2 Tax=Amphibalanus amphitrite TaxID=1232801 RepID=A0A6A4VUP1_AMPAM|nr:islet cell autoantigen 1-like isoform X2 [Amphibalanus amphitrite]XP_043235084.1 islet cell autoantigen 1-like isoform X2 [Amphibalanus amphitrite]XP_043235085.1 islet cell autoantigen 1-like isoform X2 [Amphibalanus amphitrite]XP_043235086.1 islet cell autoantigen 1-like isoform X2 [Amphibalanus amphitrite]KAF0293618.1 Islet cell autoantigen 1 [Amphibalanus amphitrite]KAF0293619.1 Islet cell autoantigen 1 [Amphibalanus amphitrite]